jgi:mono/diheme cytochrome c family protein
MADSNSTSDSTGFLTRPAPTNVLAWNSLKKVNPPLAWKLVPLIFVTLGILVLAIATRARTDTRKPSPRIHLIQDMDNQPKFKAQQSSTFFADGRSNRPPVPGTVAQGQLGMMTDGAYYDGYTLNADGSKNYVTSYPPQVQATLNDPAAAEAFIRRGQSVYNYTCINCHSADGSGQGVIHKRAVLTGSLATGWAQPAALVGTDWAKKARPNGHIYHTINYGLGNMGPQGHIIQDPSDRWAVVAYVRALGVAHASPANTQTTSAR